MATKAILDVLLKKCMPDLNPGCPHQACYQLSYCVWHDRAHIAKAYQFTMRKLENKIVYYKETVAGWHNILASKAEEGPLPYCKIGAE
jgi:hypothetical protein